MDYANIYALALQKIGVEGRVIGSGIRAIVEPDSPYSQLDFNAAVGEVVRSIKAQEIKSQAAKRIEFISPVWKQVNAYRKNTNDPMFAQIDAIRSASNVIEAEIALLTDAEAGVFDVENHIKWNV